MKKIKYTLIMISALFIITSIVTAANIGISPATVKFEDVLRGGYSQKVVTVTIDTEKETDVEIQKRGEIEDWIGFSKTKFKVSKNNPFYLTVNVTPPSDVQNANYTGFIRVKMSALDNDPREGLATGKVNPVLDLYTIVEITDIENIKCRAQNYNVQSVETGDKIKFKVDVLNNGNVRIKPRIKVDIWDLDQTNILKTNDFEKTTIAPTKLETIEFEVDSNDLELGQYWVDIAAIDCSSQDTLTFDVLEEGALKANGNLITINALTWVKLKETTQIEALFQNTGEKSIDAAFKGRITLGGKTIQIIESDKMNVDPNNRHTFQFYFTPNQAGKYIVSGRVFYDNKRTFEKSAIINVEQEGFQIKSLFKYTIYLALLIGIIFLSYKIKQEKNKYKRKMRRMR